MSCGDDRVVREGAEDCFVGLWDIGSVYRIYVGGSKIFRTNAVKTIKVTIRPIGRRRPLSSSLPHVDTGPTISSIFGTHPGSSFL